MMRGEQPTVFFHVEPGQLLLTNGTDEAIQVLINTYVDDSEEVLLLHPSYAMYALRPGSRSIHSRGRLSRRPLEFPAG